MTRLTRTITRAASLGPVPPMILITAASVFLRLVSALYQGNSIQPLPGTYDQVSYHSLASRVLEGHGFTFGTDWWPATRAGEPTAHWSYLYTVYLVVSYWLFGTNPIVPRLLQAIAVAILQPWLTWRIGRRLFGNRAGLLAALGVSVYGYFIYYAGALMTESFYILAILWAVDTATRLSSGEQGEGRAEWGTWASLGLSLGAAVLLRQVFLLFVPMMFLWVLFVSWKGKAERRPTIRRALSGLVLAGLIVTALIVPWSVRNYRAFGKFVLLNTNAGFAFFWGNHPVHGSNFIPILKAENPSYGELIPAELRRLDEASLDRELLGVGIRYVLQNPQRYILLSFSRIREYFKFWPSAESSFASNVIRVCSFGIFLPLMVTGIAVATASCLKGWSMRGCSFNHSTCISHLLLISFLVFYTGIHLLTWTLVRYRLPLDGILILYAASGAIWLWTSLASLRTRPETTTARRTASPGTHPHRSSRFDNERAKTP